jgi:hypothetical protein
LWQNGVKGSLTPITSESEVSFIGESKEREAVKALKRSRAAMKASLMTFVGAASVLAASLTGASAQVLNLTGQFQCVRLCFASPPAFAYLTQADWELNLVNEAGVPSRGWIDYPGHIWVAAWNEGAFYSPDGMTIQFENGSVWQRVIEVPVVAPVIRRHYRPYRPIASNG